jgi:hypothetical protein
MAHKRFIFYLDSGFKSSLVVVVVDDDDDDDGSKNCPFYLKV